MIAVDTNAVVRFLTQDDAAQAAARARTLIDTHRVLVPSTVILESIWVLRRRAGMIAETPLVIAP